MTRDATSNRPPTADIPDGSQYLNEEQKDRARSLWNQMWEAGHRGEDLEPYAEALWKLVEEGRRMNGPKDEESEESDSPLRR